MMKKLLNRVSGTFATGCLSVHYQALSVLAAVLFAQSTGFGTTRVVYRAATRPACATGEHYETITAAVAAAGTSDEIIICDDPVPYQEGDIEIPAEKNLTIRGGVPQDYSSTVIQGSSDNASIFKIIYPEISEHTGLTLYGLTFKYLSQSDAGRGISFDLTSTTMDKLTVKYCKFTNTKGDCGSAIMQQKIKDVQIEHCIFTNNDGWGVLNFGEGTDVSILKSKFEDNTGTVLTASTGQNLSALTIDGCTFTGNQQEITELGMLFDSRNVTGNGKIDVKNSIISSNNVSNNDIFLSLNPIDYSFENCEVLSNTCNFFLRLKPDRELTIVNSDIRGNNFSSMMLSGVSNSTIVINNSVLENNNAGDNLIEAYIGTCQLSSVKIFHNEVSVDGGSLLTMGSAFFENALVFKNKVAPGHSIILGTGGGAGINIINSTIYDNLPKVSGGNPVIYQIRNINEAKNTLVWDNGGDVLSYPPGGGPTTSITSYIKEAPDMWPPDVIVSEVGDPDYPSVVPDYNPGDPGTLVDEGTNVTGLDKDLAGNPRNVDGDGNGDEITDIGAYEYQVPPLPEPNFNIVMYNSSSTPCRNDYDEDAPFLYVPHSEDAGLLQAELEKGYVENGIKIILCQGNYEENLVIPSKLTSGITIEGDLGGGGELLAQLDGVIAGRVIDHEGQEWDNFTFKNLVIKNGYESNYCGGIRIPWGSQGVKITNCSFQDNFDNDEYVSGGALYIQGFSDVTISECEFVNNNGILFANYNAAVTITNSIFQANSSGIYSTSDVTFNISGSVFDKNDFAVWGEASGYTISDTKFTENDVSIYHNGWFSRLSMDHVDFTDNTSELINGSHVQADYCNFINNGSEMEPLNYYLVKLSESDHEQDIHFNHCIFSRNVSERYLLYLGEGAEAQVKNCLFFENKFDRSSGYAGGLIKADYLTLLNSTLYNNYGFNTGPNPSYQLSGFTGSAGSTIRNSIIYHDDRHAGKVVTLDPAFPSAYAATFSIIRDWTLGGEGVSTVLPKLVNTDPAKGDLNFRLYSGSDVGINQGDPAYSPVTGEKDLADNPRIWDDPEITGDRIDIGAYELQQKPGLSIFITVIGGGYYAPIDANWGGNGDEGFEMKDGILNVTFGMDLKIFMNPTIGYVIDHVVVDGDYTHPIPADELILPPVGDPYRTYLFEDISESHSLEITFVHKTFNVVTTADEPAKLSVFPGADVKVNSGLNKTFTFRVLPGNSIKKLTVTKQSTPPVVQEITDADLTRYYIEEIDADYLIEVEIDACVPPKEVFPNYVTTSTFLENGDEMKSFTVPDGFGKVIQAQSAVGVANYNVVSGAYFDQMGRQTYVPMPFVHHELDPEVEFKFLQMGCKDLLVRANKYYDGDEDDTEDGENGYATPNAGQRAFSETLYRNEPTGSIFKAGSPGTNYSIDGHFPKSWSLGVAGPASFLPSSTFVPNEVTGYNPETYLDDLYETQDAESEGFDYVLSVVRDADDNYSQSIADKFGNTLKVWSNPELTSETTVSISQTEYDLLGRPVRTVLENGIQAQITTYNSLGQAVSTATPDEGEVRTAYDNLGRVRFTQNVIQRDHYEEKYGHFTVYNYDDLGRKTEIGITNAAGADFQSPDGDVDYDWKIRTIYDEITVADIQGFGVSAEVAAAIHMGLENLNGRTAAVVVKMDDGGIIADINSYYANGLVQAAYSIIPTLPVQRFVYEYRKDGTMTNRLYYNGIVSGNWNLESDKEIAYNALQQIASVKENGKKFIEYTHNYMGSLQKKQFFRSDNTTSPIGMEYINTIDGLSDINTLTSVGNSFSQTLTYNSDDLVPKTYTGRIQSSAFSYMVNGNSVNETYKYYYNDEQKLKRVDKDATPNYASYLFDNVGRLASKTENGVTISPYTYRAGKNQLVNAGPKNSTYGNFLHDPNGNMVLDRSKKMVIDYDWRGKATTFNFYSGIPDQALTWSQIKDNGLASFDGITRQAKVSMSYDAGGNRVLKVENKGGVYNATGYVGNLSVFKNTDPGNPATMALKYVNLVTPGGVTGKRNKTGGEAEFFYLKDHQGSARLVYNANGNSSDEANAFMPYGIVNENIMPPIDEHVKELFTGKELDYEGSDEVAMGLYYFGARFYDPELGVWLTPDPAGQFFNPYGYGGDPVNGVDQDGEFIFTTAFIVAVAVGATMGGVQAYKAGYDLTDWESYAMVGGGAAIGAAAAVTGGAAGAAAGAAGGGFVGGLAAGASTGALGGLGNYTLGSGVMSGFSNFDAGDALKASAIGAAGGAVGGGISGSGILRKGIVNAFGSGFAGGTTGGLLSGQSLGDAGMTGLVAGGISSAAYTANAIVDNYQNKQAELYQKKGGAKDGTQYKRGWRWMKPLEREAGAHFRELALKHPELETSAGYRRTWFHERWLSGKNVITSSVRLGGSESVTPKVRTFDIFNFHSHTADSYQPPSWGLPSDYNTYSTYFQPNGVKAYVYGMGNKAFYNYFVDSQGNGYRQLY